MDLTTALLGEHAVLHTLLDRIERAAPGWDLGACQEWGRLLEAALETHAGLEDRLLFLALEPALGTQGGPLAVMRLEHERIEGAIHRLAAAADAAEARRLLAEIAATARAHFAKEENVLFPMAARFLGTGRLEELGAEWAAARIPQSAHCG